MHFTYKNIVLIVVSVLIVGGAFAFAEYRNRQAEKVVYSAVTVAPAANAISSDAQDIDTDKDGLKDWEEVLLGSNPSKADTDGDGTDDGAEVHAGRNPLVKGPNDSAKETAKDATTPKNLTPTEKIARDFFARYMELSQAGMADDSQSQAELINTVLQNGIVIEKPKALTEKDILISSDSSAIALREYGNIVGTIFKNNPHPSKDEAVIAKDALDKDDPSILKGIDPIIASYRAILSSLKKVPAPQSIAQLHLDLVNAMNKYLFVAESLRHADVDTLKGIQGTANYLDVSDSLLTALKGLGNFFADQKIVFDTSEGGKIFIKK